MADGEVITALILLPESYNPNESGVRKPVEREKFVVTQGEVGRRFGGGFFHEPGTGFWFNRGIVTEESMKVLEVDISTSTEDREWIRSYVRDALLERFDQLEIRVKFVGLMHVETFVAKKNG